LRSLPRAARIRQTSPVNRRPASGKPVTVALIASAAIALAACTASVPATTSSEASAGPAKADWQLQPRCAPPTGDRGLKDAAAANRLVAATDLPEWQAADIGASARLSDGRIAWVFGDTLQQRPSPRIVANSMLITAGVCISQLIPAAQGAVIPDIDEKTVYWPMSAAVLRMGSDEDELLVLASRIRRGGSPYDFTFLGTSAAMFEVGRLGVPRLQEIHQVTPDDPSRNQVNWGAATVVHGDRLYVYGTKLTGQKLSFGRELHVARIPIADPSNRKGWQFWDGERWQGDVSASAAVLPAQGGVSQTLSVDVVGDAFIAVSKRDGDLGNFVYTWTSPGPTGPWTPRRAIRAPAGFDTGALQYAPLAHPEVPLDSGELLVSISRNTTDLAALVKNPDLGRPRFAQVPMPAH
jgi:hypothetical protein